MSPQAGPRQRVGGEPLEPDDRVADVLRGDGAASGGLPFAIEPLEHPVQQRPALARRQRAVALDGTEFNAMFNLIDVLSRAGQLDAARPYAEQFIATAPPQLGREVEAVKRLIGK